MIARLAKARAAASARFRARLARVSRRRLRPGPLIIREEVRSGRNSQDDRSWLRYLSALPEDARAVLEPLPTATNQGGRARKGQCFHQPCLGTREFAARFALIEPGEALPAAIDDDRDIGFMLYDIDHDRGGASSFFRARLDRGILRVPPPQSPEVRR